MLEGKRSSFASLRQILDDFRSAPVALDVGFVLLILLISVVLFGYTTKFSEGVSIQTSQLSPAFWPRLVLAGFVLSCVVRIHSGIRTLLKRTVAGSENALEPVKRRKVLICIVLVTSYVALIGVIGFPLSTLLFFVSYIYLAGWRRPISLLAIAVVGTVSTLFLFVKVVYLSLPKGQGVFEDLTVALYRLLHIY